MVFGLIPPGLAVRDQPAAVRSPMLVLLVLLGAGYAVLVTWPRNRAVRPGVFVALLVAALGLHSYLLDGGAAMLVVSLPQFWIFGGGARRAIALTAAGTAAVLAGDLAQDLPRVAAGGNLVAALVGCAAGILGGLLVRRIERRGDERAAELGAELDDARLELARAHQRQGAAEERERIAREIHDTLAQGFASIVALAEAARSGLATDPDASARQLTSIERTARENLAEARVLVGSATRPPGSVARTLRRALDRFAEDTGVRVTADLPDVDCDQPTRIALLRCTQESLANVRKHAAASAVGVVLTRRPDGVELEITDDGRGFAVADSRGFGLDGMRRRLAELGGELTVTSAPGDGTRVLAAIPLDREG
ncbi:sensor histidine kinase [Actinomadura sp. WAC 06369]|nr:sensor histidine kinase [Actinomadura sp. WAC 06369]